MKKFLIVMLVFLMLLLTFVPAFAYHGGGSNGNSTGDGEPPGWADVGRDGEPPGWSKVNPGEGGSGTGP